VTDLNSFRNAVSISICAIWISEIVISGQGEREQRGQRPLKWGRRLDSIRACRAVAICLIVILLVVSYPEMVLDLFSEISTPVVAVPTFYKGLGPSEIERITLGLEQFYCPISGRGEARQGEA
jgi:hypothetical protein